MKATKKRAAKKVAPAVIAAPDITLPTIPMVTADELAKVVSRNNVFHPHQHRDTAVRPSWSKGSNPNNNGAVATLHCTCNCDTVFELKGDGTAPKPNCCVNTIPYPTDTEFYLHLFVKPQLDVRVAERIKNYDTALDANGGRQIVCMGVVAS
jgi:hypothetical protein